MAVNFKENSTVAKYSGEVQDFNYRLDNGDIFIAFQNVYNDSIVQISLGGLVMTEDNDFIMLSEEIRIKQRDEQYLEDNMTIMIFKQASYGEGL